MTGAKATMTTGTAITTQSSLKTHRFERSAWSAVRCLAVMAGAPRAIARTLDGRRMTPILDLFVKSKT